METTFFSYADWLKTHARTKTSLEKLERSLVPFDLFSQIDIFSVQKGVNGEIEHEGNKYWFVVRDVYENNHLMVYEIDIHCVSQKNKWKDVLMGYTNFKVVTNENKIVTIYSTEETFFQDVLTKFETERYEELFPLRSVYLNNLLARYIIIRLSEEFLPTYRCLRSYKTDSGNLSVLMSDEVAHWILYAFTKKEANELARQHDKISKKLTVVYFVNQNFVDEKLNDNYRSRTATVVSIKEFYKTLNVRHDRRVVIERQIMFLLQMLHKSKLNWDENELLKAIKSAPTMASKKVEYMSIPAMLLEDALNVLVEDYGNLLDIFHFLCAGNLVNAYTNILHREKGVGYRRMSTIYRFKVKIFDVVLRLLEERNPNVKIALCHYKQEKEFTLLINVCVEKEVFQFRFRGMSPSMLEKMYELKINTNGAFAERRMQPIAPALYLYSYCLRWR